MKTLNSHHRKIFRRNAELADIFRRMAACYRYLGPDERFRAQAYENASRTLSNMSEDIIGYAGDVKTLDTLQGIGESIGEKIIEYIQTGHIATFEKLRKKVPDELVELMSVSGVGPATVRTLHGQFGIHNKEDLVAALEQGKLSGVRGFGERKIANLARVLKVEKPAHRLPLAKAEKIAGRIVDAIRAFKGVHRAEVAGSIRRKKETIGDIDIIVLASLRDRPAIIRQFVSLPGIHKVLAKGTTRASIVLEEQQVQVDIRIVNDYEFGAALLYFTGSRDHNVRLRLIAKNRGYKINEYGLFDVHSGKRIAGDTEESMYDALGLRYIPPEKRLGGDEIDRASK